MTTALCILLGLFVVLSTYFKFMLGRSEAALAAKNKELEAALHKVTIDKMEIDRGKINETTAGLSTSDAISKLRDIGLINPRENK